jgi:flagellar basal-body rod modification protein FlgD
MAVAIAGTFNHAMLAAQALTGPGATPMASSPMGAAGTDSTSTSDSSSASISANDFLTLLVTEMKNQDPTANTDPNEYINQLVNVNSLEQLININQNLSTALGYSNTGSGSTGTAQAAGATSGVNGASTAGTSSNLADIASAAKRAPGNLSVPDANPAAHGVAQALGGQSRAHAIAGGLTVAK